MIAASSLPSAVSDITVTAIVAFVLSMALTPIYTTLAFRYRAWKKARYASVTGEKAKVFLKLHGPKHERNIPTMAGIVTVVAIAAVTLLLNLNRQQTYLPLFGTVAAGGIGLIDDLINIRGRGLGVAGLRSQLKFGLILAIALTAGFYSYFKLGYTSINVPWLEQVNIGIWLIPLFALVIIATANAVNITDGLDGLAGGLVAIAFGTYAVIALLQGHVGIAAFCTTVVGSVLAYTWFNIYPARFFMGDVGSFALGTALGIVALVTDTIFLLPVIGGMFVIEAGSSLLQVASKKIFKRKIFKVAPIHHHFEAMGWPETKVTMRFWVLGSVFAVLGLAIAIVGGQI
ncbi:phospho-N-acetylmuramoyl-pentapeptide-transferase [Candidatus Microgenomates bacterium]|nr:phospho-N-acetylmuramoyl-pentapeptide-transferase [Candidatus Microgenomates bacterium]